MQQFIAPGTTQVQNELNWHMDVGMRAVREGKTPKPRSAKDLLDKNQLQAVRDLAVTISQNVMRKHAAEASSKKAIQVDSDSSDGIREVFNHDESEDEEYFQLNKAAHRTFYFYCWPRIYIQYISLIHL